MRARKAGQAPLLAESADNRMHSDRKKHRFFVVLCFAGGDA